MGIVIAGSESRTRLRAADTVSRAEGRRLLTLPDLDPATVAAFGPRLDDRRKTAGDRHTAAQPVQPPAPLPRHQPALPRNHRIPDPVATREDGAPDPVLVQGVQG